MIIRRTLLTPNPPQVLPELISGKFENPIAKVFKFEEIKEAHELMESNNTQGKIVCVIE